MHSDKDAKNYIEDKTMNKYTFLFSGQGAQFQGMVQDLCTKHPAAQNVINAMSAITNEDISALLWNTERTDLSRSDKSQLAITAASQAIVAVLTENEIIPTAVAGFSLGEFSALHTAGILSFENMVRLVQKRGQIMQKCCDAIIAASPEGATPGMVAVLKLPPEQVVKALAPYTQKGIAFPVNMNSPMQTVVAGTAEGLAITETICKEAGAKRVIRLAVAGPFHSPLMQAAADEFEKELTEVIFNDPKIPLFSNVTGKIVRSGAEAKKNAVLHITHPVLWTTVEKELATLMKNDKDYHLLEIGPGTTLCGLWQDSGFTPTTTDANTGWTCLPTGKLEELNTIIEGAKI